MKSEIEEVEETEKEKERYYVLKGNEMKEFRENVENFVEECQLRIEELRDQFSKVKRLCCNHYVCTSVMYIYVCECIISFTFINISSYYVYEKGVILLELQFDSQLL